MSPMVYSRTIEAEANANFAGANTKRVIISSDARAIAYVLAIVGVMAVGPFALLGQHFAPDVARDLRHQSELFSQAGDHAGAVAAGRKAVDIYRGLMRVSVAQYEPRLAASLHDLSIRLHEAGDDAGALAAIREAVERRRRLARYGASYAASLEQSLQVLTRIEAARRGETF